MTLCWRARKLTADASPRLVIWDKPASGDRMAPFDAPEEHLDLVWFCSDWDYYKIAHHGSHALTHQSVAGKSTTIGNVVMVGQTLAQDQVLYTHNLGYVPRYMIAIGDLLIQNMHPVQVPDGDRVRTVSFYATATELHCINLGTSSASVLASTSITYDVLLFRPPADGFDAGLPILSAKQGVMGQGILKIDDVVLRRADIADASPFDINLGPAVDIDRGSVKWFHANGTTTTIGTYAGSAVAPDAIQCALSE